jgi:hypothetical protein
MIGKRSRDCEPLVGAGETRTARVEHGRTCARRANIDGDHD